MSEHVDVLVIGAGPGGYVAAVRAAQLGRTVVVVEERFWGGVCLNVGCIPSKSLLRNAELAETVRRDADLFGISGATSFDYGRAHARSRDVADGRAAGIHYLMRKNGITEINGRARFTSPTSVDISTADGTVRTVSFTDAIVATGARPKMPPGIEPSPNVVTYEEVVLSADLPQSMAIIGAGAIGTELAYVLNAFGVQVTILEYLDRMLPAEDADVSRELLKAYRKHGIDVLTSTRVESVHDSGSSVEVRYARDDEAAVLKVDRVLVATGFAPNCADLGLDAAGVETGSVGEIVVDDLMRTNVASVRAIGDVTMRMQLAHVAEAMGVVAAESIAGAVTMELGAYRMMPRATFCQPQVASFGLTEEQARAEHGDIKVAKFPFSANGKAHGLGHASGLVKLLADSTGALVGGHLIGPDVAELLPELTLAQKWDLGTIELSRNVHVHPTLGEAVQEALHGLEGHMVNL